MQFDKRAWLDRIKRMFAGFDRPLALIVFLLLCVGIVTLYSASLDVPGRVEDQLRNIMLTFVLMWALANVPPPTLMRFAVPLYTFGDRAADRGGAVRPHAQGREALAQCRRGDPAVGDHEDRHCR